MTILQMVPNTQHISEFHGRPNGPVYHGTCTQTSAAICVAAAEGQPTDHQGVIDLMLTMTEEMIADGAAATNGAATVANMAREMIRHGASIAIEWDYAGDIMPHDWHTLIKENAGIHPILMQLANAQALYNAHGQAEDQGVHYHAIAIVGIADEGYVVADPNNATVEQTFDIYPIQALTNARPCGLIMLNTKGPPTMLPTGWTDDGTTLTSAKGVHIINGFRAYCLEHPEFLAIAGEPLGPEYATDAVGMDPSHGTGAEQIFNCGALGWVAQTGWIGPLWVGAMYQAMQAHIDTANTTIAALQAQLAEPPTQVIDTTAVTLKAALKSFLEA